MKPRGIVTLVFDDGYERVYQNAVPLLRRYRMPAVFALPLNAQKLEKTEQRKIRPWQQWMHLRDEGYEVAAHSENHPNLTKLAPDQLDRELRVPHESLEATTLVYPGGALDDTVVEAAARYYTAGRTVHYGLETIPPREPMRLLSYNFSRNNFRVWKANSLAAWAWVTHRWLIETYHMIDDSDEQMVHTVRTKDLERHLQFVSRLPIQVKTIQQVIEGSE